VFSLSGLKKWLADERGALRADLKRLFTASCPTLDPDGVLDEFPQVLEQRLATDDKADEVVKAAPKTATDGQDVEDEFMEDSSDDERGVVDSGKLLDRLFDEPQRVAVVSGRGEFFGKAENALSGRWNRIDREGCFPAAIRTGFNTRLVVLSIAGNNAMLWQPPSLDLWRWIVVGATLALGDPVVRYDPTTGALDFLTPPPRQAERVALLTAHQTGPWSWRIDDKAYGTLARIMGKMP
jgi:hypothetical protein